MKKTAFLTTFLLTSLLASACTVTVGEKFEDDDDDSDFSDLADFSDDSDDLDDSDDDASSETTEPGETSEETTEDESTSTNTSITVTVTQDAGETTSTEPEESTSTDVDPTTTDDSTSVDPVNPVNPTASECTDFGEAYSCTECLNFHCSAEWYACCGEPGCAETWDQIKTCVLENSMNPDMPINDVDACAATAAGGDQFDLSETLQILMSCVGEEFVLNDEEGDPRGHQPGEGTCTLACYDVPTLFPPEEE